MERAFEASISKAPRECGGGKKGGDPLSHSGAPLGFRARVPAHVPSARLARLARVPGEGSLSLSPSLSVSHIGARGGTPARVVPPRAVGQTKPFHTHPVRPPSQDFYPALFAQVPSPLSLHSTPRTSQTFLFGSPVSVILCTEAHHRYLPCPAVALHGGTNRARNIAVALLLALDAKSVRQPRGYTEIGDPFPQSLHLPSQPTY